MVRCLTLGKNLPAFLWGELVRTLNHINNRCSTRDLNSITPFECLFGAKPDVSHFRITGSIAHVHIPEAMRSKLGHRFIR